MNRANYCFRFFRVTAFAPVLIAFQIVAAEVRALRVGVAGHAFDHLGNIGEQADTAAAAGGTIIYATGFGSLGYSGLGTESELNAAGRKFAAYNRNAKKNGVQLSLGYLCATSIVKLDAFDRNWSAELREQFCTPPAQWLQQDRNGNPLPSWYGGDYRPACMNNPDWRTYEKNAVRLQLESGHDGIFFDNPTVHPQGCYCEYCVKQFAAFLANEGVKIELPSKNQIPFLRELAVTRTNDFLRFRCTIARDFLAEMRRYARTIKRNALITCNNSLNAPEAFFSQCRSHAYNIHEMSKAEDFVVVEDMNSQPRALANGHVIEYGPIYELLHAISHSKPIVACTIAEGDYHTPPNLVRLAMAEAAAHNASYLAWPTWPETERARMAVAIRPQADLLRSHEKLFNNTRARSDVVVFLPFRRWLNSDQCVARNLAMELSQSNIPFRVVNEDEFNFENLKPSAHLPILLVESRSVLNGREQTIAQRFSEKGGLIIAADEEKNVCNAVLGVREPSLKLIAPTTVRAVVRDQSNRTIIHLLNLNVTRISSFQDRVQAAEAVHITCRVPSRRIRSVRALTADSNATTGNLAFSVKRDAHETSISTTLPRLKIATVLLIKH